MKTLGRIVIILCAFALVMGLTYAAVNAGSSSTGPTASTFEKGGGFPRPEGARREFRGEGDGGWMFGMIRNVGLLAVLVALIAVPKNFMQKRRRQIAARMA